VIFFSMANSGLPGTSGFVGEFMVILTLFQSNVWVAVAAATTLIIAAGYSLWLVKRVMFGPITNPQVSEMPDVSPREKLVLGLFALGVLGLGLYPKILTDLMQSSIAQLATQIATTKL